MMSSLASKQSIILLSIVNGVFIVLDEHELMQELKPTILYCRERVSQLFKLYPEVNADAKSVQLCREKLSKLSAVLDSSDLKYSPAELVHLALTIAVDLLDELTCPLKRSVLQEMFELLAVLSDKLDPDGSDFATFGKVDEQLNAIYKEIEFTKNYNYLKHKKKLLRKNSNNGA